MISALKEKFWEVAEARGVNRLLSEFASGKGWLIFCGHGICDGPLAMHTPDDRYIELATFRAEMEHLLASGYTFVTLTEGVRLMREGGALNKLVTVTFDDGMNSVVDLAYPVMTALGLKGCLFVVPGIVGTSNLLWTDMIIAVCWHRRGRLVLNFPGGDVSFSPGKGGDPGTISLSVIQAFRTLPEDVRKRCFEQIERMFQDIPAGFVPKEFLPVTWDQLRSLDPEILEVGNHTMSHPKLVNVDRAAMQEEIAEGRRRIGDELGTRVDHFCYPGAAYNADVLEGVRLSGHVSAATGVYGRNTRDTPLFELRRIGLSPTLARFKSRLSGFERLVRAVVHPGRLLWITAVVLRCQAELLAAFSG